MLLPALTVNFKSMFNYTFHHSNWCCVISASVLPEIKLSVKTATQSTLVYYSQKKKKQRGVRILHYKVIAYGELKQTCFLCSSSRKQFLNANERFMVYFPQLIVNIGSGSTQWIVLSVLFLTRSHINTNLVRIEQSKINLSLGGGAISPGSQTASYWQHLQQEVKLEVQYWRHPKWKFHLHYLFPNFLPSQCTCIRSSIGLLKYCTWQGLSGFWGVCHSGKLSHPLCPQASLPLFVSDKGFSTWQALVLLVSLRF